MASSDEGEVGRTGQADEAEDEEDDPIQTLVLDKAAARTNANATKQTDNEADDGDTAGASVVDLTGDVDGDAGAAASSISKKKRKKKRKRASSAAAMDTPGEKGDAVDASAALENDSKVTPAPNKKRKTAAAAVTLGRSPVGVILVEDGQEIARDVEVARLIRAPRYFDDDTVHVAISSRCFNCGRSGHRAGECTFAPRDKPCFLCAQFGHAAKDCFAQLCFKCGRPGHKARLCPEVRASSWELGYGRCLRCASSTCACADKADYFRYEGGCTEGYSNRDLTRCKCYVCGRYGHLCCKKSPTLPARVTCFSCGSASHLGEACPKERRLHIAAERAGDMRKAQQEREDEYERVAALAAARATQGRSNSRYNGQQDTSYNQQYNQQYNQHDTRGGAGRAYTSDRQPHYSTTLASAERSQYSEGGRRRDAQEPSYPGSLDRNTSSSSRHQGRGQAWCASAADDLAAFPGFVFGRQQQQQQQQQAYGLQSRQYMQQYDVQQGGRPVYGQQQRAPLWSSSNPYASHHGRR